MRLDLAKVLQLDQQESERSSAVFVGSIFEQTIQVNERGQSDRNIRIVSSDDDPLNSVGNLSSDCFYNPTVFFCKKILISRIQRQDANDFAIFKQRRTQATS